MKSMILAGFAVFSLGIGGAVAKNKGVTVHDFTKDGAPVSFQHSTTWDGCMANGRTKGYDDATNASWCAAHGYSRS
jgi:hypothetical protein